MQYYLGTFISNYIGNERYDLAYDLLSEGFKENYFQTYEKFEEYAKNKYPVFAVLEYGTMQRQGNIYIVDVTIEDTIKKKEEFTQTFIVKENGLNNYEISFNV